MFRILPKELGRIRNNSKFIAQTLRDKFTAERQEATQRLLEAAYQKAGKQDRQQTREWDVVGGDGIE